jgi:hypothetical protein
MISNRIAIVSNSLTGGGAERAMNFVVDIVAESHETILIPINMSESDFVKPKSKIVQIGRDKHKGLLHTIYCFLLFMGSIHRFKPTILVLNCDLPELFGALLPFKVKILVIEHVNTPYGNRRKVGRVIRWVLRKRKAHFAVVSEHLSIWPGSLPTDILLPNPIAVEFCQAEVRDNGKITELVFIGRLSNPQKNPELVLEVAKLTGLPIKFFGDGPLRSELEQKSSEMGVAASFFGHVEEPWGLLNGGSLLLIPSRFEGDGLVVVEAVYQNVPFLLSNIKDFIRFGFPPHQYASLAAEYASIIDENMIKVQSLLIPLEIRNEIKLKRDNEYIKNLWDEAIIKVTTQ